METCYFFLHDSFLHCGIIILKTMKFNFSTYILKLNFVTILTFIFYLFLQGTSTKYSPQRVGLHHVMHDEDVIQVLKK
jgi:hypothetical protein